jgi:hypothetical protein
MQSLSLKQHKTSIVPSHSSSFSFSTTMNAKTNNIKGEFDPESTKQMLLQQNKRLSLRNSVSPLSLFKTSPLLKTKKRPILWLPWQMPLIPRSRQKSMESHGTADDTTSPTDDTKIQSFVQESMMQSGSSHEESQNHHAISLQSIPTDMLVQALVFAGPRVVSKLAQTSKAFQEQLLGSDVLWKKMGESYGKVRLIFVKGS